MRTKNAAKNLILYLAYEAIVFSLGVIFPRFIILTFGSAVNGLTSTINRLLSLINLIQAGAVGAAIFQMYRPVAENDYEEQSAIIYSAKKYYSKITIVFFSVAMLAGLFYSFKLRDGSLSFIEIFLAFLILATNGSFTLYFNSVCDVFLSPHQKKYYITLSAIVSQAINYSLLTIVLLLKLHFLFIYIAILAGGLIGAALNVLFYKKQSKDKINHNPKNKDYVIPDRKYLMYSSIGSEAVTASPSIIITTILGLTYSSVFSIYAMIFTSMKTILNSIQLSVSSIFGNVVKTSSDEHKKDVYDVIELVTIMLGTVLSGCVAFLLISFIRLYTRGITDVEYIYPLLSVYVACYVVIFTFRTSFSFVATVYGLFKQTCRAVLIFGVAGIVISTLCVAIFGMQHVMIGLLFNQLGCAIATIWIIKNNVTWFRIKHLIYRSIFMVLVSISGTIMSFLLSSYLTSWKAWIFSGIVSVLVILLLCLIYCLIFDRKNFVYIKNYAKLLFIKKGE